MYKITKSISFCYGHRLLGHPGKCRHLHGHNSVAVITLEGSTLDEQGMLYDFQDIGAFAKTWIDNELDHNMLLHENDPILPALQAADERVFIVDCNPTAENIARLIFDYIAQAGYPVKNVTVWETDTCSATYSHTN